jgi:LPS-assembly protein
MFRVLPTSFWRQICLSLRCSNPHVALLRCGSALRGFARFTRHNAVGKPLTRHHFYTYLFCFAMLQPCAGVAAPGLYLNQQEDAPVTKVAIAPQEADAPVTFSADEMATDEQNGIVIARGNVEVMQGGMILMAKQITYYHKADLVVATGEVTMLQPTGDVYFAERAELKDAMKRAVIHDFKARLADKSVLVAREAIKVNSNVTALKNASYTPCNLCANTAPFWQMNAQSAVVDNIDERVTYRGAFMEMWGVPMFYTPYLSHPTPDASGRSGFLTPSYGTNPYFGGLVKVPYYWRISEDKDVVVTPWITTSEGPVLQGDYSQLTDGGKYRVRASATYPEKRDDNGNLTSGNELRGHLFARGEEMVNDDTRVGFDIQRTTDDTYLRRYSFGDQQTLFSRAYYEVAQGRNFALAQGLGIQGLRATDEGKSTPLLLPILQGYYETLAGGIDGLKFHVAADAQWLTREKGVDQRRISLTPGLTLPYVSEGGHILTTTLNLRQDIYNSQNVLLGGTQEFSGTTTRTLPQAALEWRYPLINQLASGSLVIEPVVLAVAQTTGGNTSAIANEDSTLVELTDTNLFSINRMPGLDLIDSGSRVAYGVRGHYFADSGVAIEGMLGQNFNVERNTPFPNSTRQGERVSDYIGRVAANYTPVHFAYRFAVDKEEAQVNRHEVDLGFNQPWLSFAGSYREIRNNRFLPDSREAVLTASMPLVDEWSIYGSARRDLELSQMVTSGGGLIYQNECFTFALDSLRVFTRDRDIEPTTEITFRVAFKNLGEFGGR